QQTRIVGTISPNKARQGIDRTLASYKPHQKDRTMAEDLPPGTVEEETNKRPLEEGEGSEPDPKKQATEAAVEAPPGEEAAPLEAAAPGEEAPPGAEAEAPAAAVAAP
ncbi:unnamed protein product, partial [Heterosigma akashiwo]